MTMVVVLAIWIQIITLKRHTNLTGKTLMRIKIHM